MSELELRGLSRRFGALAAVESVSMRVSAGEVHAVIGPNGAGKSTLLNLLSGELRPTAGTVRFGAHDLTRASPDRISRLGVGRSYQTANVFPELSCAECVWLAAQSRAHSSMRFFGRAAPRAEADRALEVCGLAARRFVRAAELSYGEQRQLELAMLLATNPSLLLLDEPLAGLSHGEAQQIVALLREVRRGRSVLLVEHDMEAVFSLADRVTVLVEGRVLATGAPQEIRASPRVHEAYLGEDE